MNTRRPKLADVLYTVILKAIRDKEYKEGERLPGEELLSAKYGVSRPTIREALARLRAGGFIVSRHGSGSYVGQPKGAYVFTFDEISSIADFQRYYEFRRAVESGAAAHAANRRDDEDIERIQTAYRHLKTGLDKGEPSVNGDFEFHMAIAIASKNPVFVSVLKSIRSQSLFCMALSRALSREQSAQRIALVDDEHKEIVEAILAQRPDDAATAMRSHIDNSVMRVIGFDARP